MKFFASISEAFVQGGTWMWLILAVQVAATAIIIERVSFLYFRRKSNQRAFAAGFESLIRRGQLSEASQLAERELSQQPLASAVLNGLQAAMNLGGKDEIQGKMDEALLAENARIEKRTSFLPMLANVGTLTGLLGTVTGMITSFSAVGDKAGPEKTAVLSSGISEAMNATAYGLIMAIPTLIMYAILSNRASALSEDLNQAGLKIYNWLSFAYEPVEVRRAAARSKHRSATEKTVDNTIDA
ncbi:MAG: MotA/TolQ/ExbB proton channel family protein [Bdellovibrionales bacterium]|nr:MotA/TolQ/ExbB proton channel family protein [Bdellovibrionales bacterium]